MPVPQYIEIHARLGMKDSLVARSVIGNGYKPVIELTWNVKALPVDGLRAYRPVHLTYKHLKKSD